MIVPVGKNECPLDVIAKMGEKTRDAWLFLDHNCKEDLMKRAGDVITREGESCYEGMTHTLVWEATDKFPAAEVVIDLFTGHEGLIGTWAVKEIKADDIAFKKRAPIPTEVYVFEKKM